MTAHRARDLVDTPLADLVDLRGRTAVVTGAGRGIGLAICHRFAEAGATVVLSDVDEDVAGSAAAEVRARWSNAVHGVPADVTDRGAVDRLADHADSLGTGLSIWINNAGIYPSRPLIETEDADWERVMDITLDGTFYGCRAAARRMVARPNLPGRVILNMSSLSGMRGRRNLSGYVAAKHAVTGLVRSLALELGEAGIRVVGLAPSVVDTPGMQQRRAMASPEDAERLRQMETAVAAAVPLGRGGVPDDVARAALYLCSDLAEFVSGVVLPVDGGVDAG